MFSQVIVATYIHAGLTSLRASRLPSMTHLRACALHEVQEIMSKTKFVTQCLEEAAAITCTCEKQSVDAVLTRALTSAREVIKLLEHELSMNFQILER